MMGSSDHCTTKDRNQNEDAGQQVEAGEGRHLYHRTSRPSCLGRPPGKWDLRKWIINGDFTRNHPTHKKKIQEVPSNNGNSFKLRQYVTLEINCL